MKLWAISSLVGLALTSSVHAADVQYAVIAFPKNNENVAVSVGGQNHPLQPSQQHPNLFVGSAPSADSYQYVLTNGNNSQPEAHQRKLAQGATQTGNEFFNRSQTIYNVPDMPQAYNPIYPPLFSNMNRSNEIATIIVQANSTAFKPIIEKPLEDHKYAEAYNVTYISNQEVYTFTGAGIKNSGQSSKDYAKQSFKIKLNKFSNKNATKELLFGRTVLKLRAEETDPTMAREKLFMDCLAAAGGATLSGSWVRLFVNDKPYGLYLMADDATTHFIDAALHGGNFSYPYTGPTYKGNAMSDKEEGNMMYLGPDQKNYKEDVYKLEDDGEVKLAKNETYLPLISFLQRLDSIDPTQATDANNQGNLSSLLNPQHLMIHMAMNFLGGSWDGFWYQASNYYLNEDLQSKQWTLISYDFDETMGVGDDKGLSKVAYQNYTKPNAKRPLIDKILKSPYYTSQFEDVLKTIIKRFFNPRVLNPRLQAWTEMLREDIAWDRSLESLSPGEKPKWTLDDFVTNMNTTIKEGTIGLAEWVKVRSQATCQQLNFNDTDDLPPVGPYTGGRHMNGNDQGDGNSGNQGNGNADNVNGNGNGANNSSKNAQGSADSAAVSFLSSLKMTTGFLAISFVCLSLL
ncbi:coth protein-domain-containing protein [Radiomyces spectabilis]|uniref:coth protein-domain-containing protein n=1 Tax=Radiomyces spectabilis TaxID=64574 RepID=UPI0022206796|nr:coth protein-domain-containing protein [Radiomyces spectabilis]KAI8377397.1 coth protein-domain-containing protein [Radiomyces spectabilis]